jgi:hypothetical protein
MGMTDPFTDMKSLQATFNQLSQMGLFQASKDVPDIMKTFAESVKAIRTIMVSAQTTMQEAMPIFAELRSIGFTPGQAGAQVQGMAAGQRAGIPMMQQFQSGMASAQMAMSQGVGGAGAFEGGAGMARMMGIARQQGIMSQESFQRLTMGTGQASVFSQQVTAQTLQMAQGPAGMAFGAAFGTGGSAALAGTRGFGQIIGAGAGNMRSPESLMGMLNRQDLVAEEILNDPLAAAKFARSMSRELKLPGGDAGVQTVLQSVMGFQPVQAREMVKLLNAAPRIEAVASINTFNQQHMERAQIRARELRPDAIFKRMSFAAYRSLQLDDIAGSASGFFTGMGDAVQSSWNNFIGLEGGARGDEGTLAATAAIIRGGGDEALRESAGSALTKIRKREFGRAAPGTMGRAAEEYGGALTTAMGAMMPSGGKLLGQLATGLMAMGGSRAGGAFASLGGDIDEQMKLFDFAQTLDPTDLSGPTSQNVTLAKYAAIEMMKLNPKIARMSNEDRMVTMHAALKQQFGAQDALEGIHRSGLVNVVDIARGVDISQAGIADLAKQQATVTKEIAGMLGRGSTTTGSAELLLQDPNSRSEIENAVRQIHTGGDVNPGTRKNLEDAIAKSIMTTDKGTSAEDAKEQARERTENILDSIKSSPEKRRALKEKLSTLKDTEGTRRYVEGAVGVQALVSPIGQLLEDKRAKYLSKQDRKSLSDIASKTDAILKSGKIEQFGELLGNLTQQASRAYSATGEGAAERASLFAESLEKLGLDVDQSKLQEISGRLRLGGEEKKKAETHLRGLVADAITRKEKGGLTTARESGDQNTTNRLVNQGLAATAKILIALASGTKLPGDTAKELAELVNNSVTRPA